MACCVALLAMPKTCCILCKTFNFLFLTPQLYFSVSTTWVSVTAADRHKEKSQPRTTVFFVGPIPAVILTITVKLLGQALCDIATWKVAQGAHDPSSRNMIFQRVTVD